MAMGIVIVVFRFPLFVMVLFTAAMFPAVIRAGVRFLSRLMVAYFLVDLPHAVMRIVVNGNGWIVFPQFLDRHIFSRRYSMVVRLFQFLPVYGVTGRLLRADRIAGIGFRFLYEGALLCVVIALDGKTMAAPSSR